MSGSDADPDTNTDTEPVPIPVDATAELDPSRHPECPLRIDVEVPDGFDVDAISDAVRLDVRAADE